MNILFRQENIPDSAIYKYPSVGLIGGTIHQYGNRRFKVVVHCTRPRTGPQDYTWGLGLVLNDLMEWKEVVCYYPEKENADSEAIREEVVQRLIMLCDGQ